MSTSFPPPRDPAHDADHPLARAFRSFTEAAGSLERTYGQLQRQVAHLRQELEVTNRDLSASLEENRRMRERLHGILEGLPCGVLATESGGQISILNPEAMRLLGANPPTIAALPAALASALEKARLSGEECELELTAGSAAPVCLAIRHARLEGNQETGSSVFILRDTSAARQIERDRENLRRQQALVEMSALLAHEIRNPLGSLELFTGLLAESVLEGEGHRWVEHLQAGLRSLSSTVNNVLDLHNEPPPERASIDAGELLGWAYDFLLPLAHQARVELQIVNGLCGVPVAADRHLLEQVLLNLALNAFHFMPGGGWLAIRGVNRGVEGIEIEVRDTGQGISEEDLPRIFEAGFTTRPGSTGLGLAVCRRVLDQHGGSIMAESQIGHGATFRLRLPAASASASASAPCARVPIEMQVAAQSDSLADEVQG
ncbi:MAG: HAMP domain-containing sensor histidine kinase [Terriglobales bacterium]|jgi:signal transduction histidine kinase